MALNAHQLQARGAKGRATKALGSNSIPSHFDLDKHHTGVRSCVTIGGETSIVL